MDLRQLAPVYLSACPRQGLGMLETLLIKQPVSNSDRLALKVCLLSYIGDPGFAHICEHTSSDGVIQISPSVDPLLVTVHTEELK